MMRRVWIASYMKSGSTWFRILLANLLSGKDVPVNINKLPAGHIASSRADFSRETLIDSGLLTHDEVDRLRPLVYEALARTAPRDDTVPSFAKVHDAYDQLPGGEPLLAGARGADGAIVIVRDPRDVVVSLARHLDITVDEAVTLMNDDDMALAAKTDRQPPQLRQKFHSWSSHAESWLGQRDIAVHVLRYEDLHRDTAATFRAALAFCGMTPSEAGLARAVSLSAFDRVKAQEAATGFAESPGHLTAHGGFFHRGEAGGWRRHLSPGQVARLERAHAATMHKLGYGLSQT